MADPIQLESLNVDDFKGGMTDRYIGARPDQGQSFRNFVIRKHGDKGKLLTRPGSQIYDEDYYQIPAGSQRLVDLEDLEDQLFQFSARNVYYIDSGWNTLEGPTTNPVFTAGSATDYISKAKWNKHLLVVNDAFSNPMKIFKDSGGTFNCRNLGLPTIDSSGITLTPGAGAGTYLYAFIHSDTYTIGTLAYREVSGVSDIKTCASAAAPNVTPIAVAVIPVLANGATDNYNTTAIKIEIYRTTESGTQFYKVGEVTNGTTTFNDTVSDATLVTNEPLYTEGDVVDFTQAPPSKYILVAGNVAFYLHVKDGSTVYPNKIRHSVPGAMYASPEDFEIDVDDEIIGGGVVAQTPVVFCKNGLIYRLEGFVDEQGRGVITPEEISRTVTLASHRSVVPTKDGLFFAAEDGFYFTNGIEVIRISEEIPDTYATLAETATQRSRIYGTYNVKNNRVEWAVQLDSGGNDNDSIYCCDLKWGIKPDMPFSDWCDPITPDNFQPTCLKYFNGQLLRGDRRGYLFAHDENYLSDPKIDTGTTPDEWVKKVIFFDYRSSAFDFGSTTWRKWVPEITLYADNITNVAILVQSNNDNTGDFRNLAEIYFENFFQWGDPNFVWGNENFTWNYSTLINAWRRFPKGGLRCSYKQIRITPSDTLLDSYSTIGTASSDGSANTLTLDDVTKAWLDDPVDYYVGFEDDDYNDLWQVESRDSDTVLTLVDADATLATDTGRNWKMFGYTKDQVLSLLSYTIRFSYLGRTQEQFTERT